MRKDVNKYWLHLIDLRLLGAYLWHRKSLIMTKAEENRVRRLVHGSRPGNITAEESVEELDWITGRSPTRRTEELPLIQETIQTVIEDRAAVG